MSTSAEQSRENIRPADASRLPSLHGQGEDKALFEDNRPQTIVLKKVAEFANLSPQGRKLNALQTIANTRHPVAAPIQKIIAISSDKTGGTLKELYEKLTVDPDQYGLRAETLDILNTKGLSLESLLEELDLQNKTFANYRALVVALKGMYLSKLHGSELGKAFVNENITSNFHPLVHEESQSVQLLVGLFGPNAPPIREILLGQTAAANFAMDEYTKGRAKGKSDAILVKAILAAIELHNAGATQAGDYSEEEKHLLQIATDPYDAAIRDQLLDDYGLDVYERRSIVAYSFPHKGDMLVDEKWNQFYMGYSPNNWGHYEDGWSALAAAFRKLPSVGALGLKVRAYRASRNSTESTALKNLAPGTEIEHGKQVMNQGQHHYTSTSLTYSVHNHPGRVKEAGGMLAVNTTSGVYINPFGGFGFLDGAEVLIPPGARTAYAGRTDRGYRADGVEAPVYHLDERSPIDRPSRPPVDDKDFTPRSGQDDELAARLKEQTNAAEARIKKLAKSDHPGIVEVLKKYSIYDSNSSLSLFFLFSNIDLLLALEKDLQQAFENTTRTELIEGLRKAQEDMGIALFSRAYEYLVKNINVYKAPLQKLQAVLIIMDMCRGPELLLLKRIESLCIGNRIAKKLLSRQLSQMGFALMYVGEINLRKIIVELALTLPENAYVENVLRL